MRAFDPDSYAVEFAHGKAERGPEVVLRGDALRDDGERVPYCVGWPVSAVNDRHVTMRGARNSDSSSAFGDRSQRLGSTYASEDYQDLLAENSIACSMSRCGNCLDNAAMDSWFSTLKVELRGLRIDSPPEGAVVRLD